MSSLLRPLPEPLKASEVPSFTHFSVVVRLPDIARRTLAENTFPPETIQGIQQLIQEIPDGKIRPVHISDECLARDWAKYISPYLGRNWLEVPWFFAEEYFYVRILEAAGYFQPGEWHHRDPYAHQKQLGLVSTKADIFALTERITFDLDNSNTPKHAALERILLADLWGNMNDLSMWPVQKEAGQSALSGGSAIDRENRPSQVHQENSGQIHNAGDRLLVDDRPALFEYLSGLKEENIRIDLLLDNAGYELVTDLALAGYLLTSRLAAQVVLHGKAYPVFVSDAVEQDIFDTIDFMTFAAHEPTRSLGIRLRSLLVEGRLKLFFDPFWTSPLAAWEMPEKTASEINNADLLISKGDANYRRLLGDRHWPLDSRFSDVVNYFHPAVLALRTLKSEIAVGVPSNRIPSSDPEWMINGRWGLIQFAPSRNSR